MILAGLGALGAGEAPPSTTDAAAARQEALVTDLGPACDDARFLIAAGRTDAAIARLEQALAAAGEGGDARRRLEAERLLAKARSAAAAAGSAAADDARNASASAVRNQLATEQHAATSQRNERLARIADLQRRGHLELALAHCRTLQSDLPGDVEVEARFRELLAAVHASRRTSLDEREAELRQEISASISRSLIPEGFDGVPIYPSDWGQRHHEANRLEAPQTMPEWKAAILDRLAQRVDVRLDDTAINDALTLIGRLGNINLVVSAELQASTQAVTLHANAMPLSDVLTWTTEQAGTQWSVDSGAVSVGVRSDQARLTALHEIGALLVGVTSFTGPNLNLGTTGAAVTPAAENRAAPSGDDIAELIKRSVSPRTWTLEGNSITVRGNALWVTAPEDVHRLIREFLRVQSAQQALAVRLDTRWIELSDTVVEEIGVQWQSKPTDQINAAIPGNAGFLRNLEGWSLSGTSTNALPASAVNARTGAANQGLTLQAALIGGNQLSAVLSALETNAQGRVLQAPELTCLNGQNAYTYLGTDIAYIADYQVSGANYDPTIKVLNTGSLLEVRPVVSSDRRYVTFDLRSTNSSVSLYTEYLQSSIAIQGYQGNANNAATIVPGATFPLELPTMQIETVNTTVLVPDRGSLLIGGFRRAIDQFSASRVPLLGSVPFLGRLFGARGRYVQNSQLYLLTTVTILNYPELEARL